jgi:hypothetical protein
MGEEISPEIHSRFFSIAEEEFQNWEPAEPIPAPVFL